MKTFNTLLAIALSTQLMISARAAEPSVQFYSYKQDNYMIKATYFKDEEGIEKIRFERCLSMDISKCDKKLHVGDGIPLRHLSEQASIIEEVKEWNIPRTGVEIGFTLIAAYAGAIGGATLGTALGRQGAMISTSGVAGGIAGTTAGAAAGYALGSGGKLLFDFKIDRTHDLIVDATRSAGTFKQVSVDAEMKDLVRKLEWWLGQLFELHYGKNSA